MAVPASRLRAAILAGMVCAIVVAAPARAQIGSDRYAAMVVEARNGGVLLAANADEPRFPASLTKMMTVYMALEAIRAGRLHRSTPIIVSGTAAAMPPSRLGLAAGMTLTVEEAILALVTKSANDAAAALGEHMGGGSEARFAQMMTLRARSLGMTRTTFRNASGLPDFDQVSTARDMTLLGRRLIQDFPQEYGYFSTPSFVFRGRMHWNHNRLLQEYEGTDGIKTGYVNDSGFNLVASTERDGVRLVAAVFGGRTGRERDRHMMAILDQGFLRMGVALREAPVRTAAAPRPVVLGRARAATPGRAPVLVGTRQPAAKAGAAAAPAQASRTTTAARAAPAPAAPAKAASVARATPPRAVPLPMPPPRTATLRLTAAHPPRTVASRIEQGDGGRAAATRKPATSTTARR